MERVKRKRLLWWFEEWELEEMQNWLSEMAQQGWHLESGDGRASFRQGSRQRVRYRCEYGDVEGLPAEQLEIYAAAGWEYVRQHGHVHIFRAPDDQSIPEIHTEVASRLRMLRPLARNLILSALLFVAWVTLSLWLRLPDSEPLELQMLLSTGPATLVALGVIIYVAAQMLLGIMRSLRLIHQLRGGARGQRQRSYQQARRSGQVRLVTFALILALLVGQRIADSRASSFPPIPDGELPMIRLSEVLDITGVPWQRSTAPEYLQEKAGGDVWNCYLTRSSILVPFQAMLAERVELIGEDNADLWLTSYAYQARTPRLARYLAEQLLRRQPSLIRAFKPRQLTDETTPQLVSESPDAVLWQYDGSDEDEFILWKGHWVYQVFCIGNGELMEELLQQTLIK